MWELGNDRANVTDVYGHNPDRHDHQAEVIPYFNKICQLRMWLGVRQRSMVGPLEIGGFKLEFMAGSDSPFESPLYLPALYIRSLHYTAIKWPPGVRRATRNHIQVSVEFGESPVIKFKYVFSLLTTMLPSVSN
jgi:hypothetical protein